MACEMRTPLTEDQLAAMKEAAEKARAARLAREAAAQAESPEPASRLATQA